MAGAFDPAGPCPLSLNASVSSKSITDLARTAFFGPIEADMTTPRMAPSFADAVRHNLRAAVKASLPCQAAPVRLALDMLISEKSEPTYTLIACSLDDSDASLHIGAALDLLHIGLQRLHAQLASPEPEAFLGQGAAVLAGDYLTSGAFKLLIRCQRMDVLREVAGAIALTCERECFALSAHVPAISRSGPLGTAAARAAATLAGYSSADVGLASQFGAEFAASRSMFAAVAAHGVAARALALALKQSTGNARPHQLASSDATHRLWTSRQPAI